MANLAGASRRSDNHRTGTARPRARGGAHGKTAGLGVDVCHTGGGNSCAFTVGLGGHTRCTTAAGWTSPLFQRTNMLSVRLKTALLLALAASGLYALQAC